MYLKQTGIGDTVFMGPEAEFFVFDDVRFDQSQPNAGYYYLDSAEGAWNSGREEFPEPRLQDAPQGRLPGSADRHARRLAPGDDDRAARERHRDRSRSPRSRDGRPVRDRHEVQAPSRMR